MSASSSPPPPTRLVRVLRNLPGAPAELAEVLARVRWMLVLRGDQAALVECTVESTAVAQQVIQQQLTQHRNMAQLLCQVLLYGTDPYHRDPVHPDHYVCATEARDQLLRQHWPEWVDARRTHTWYAITNTACAGYAAVAESLHGRHVLVLHM